MKARVVDSVDARRVRKRWRLQIGARWEVKIPEPREEGESWRGGEGGQVEGRCEGLYG